MLLFFKKAKQINKINIFFGFIMKELLRLFFNKKNNYCEIFFLLCFQLWIINLKNKGYF